MKYDYSFSATRVDNNEEVSLDVYVNMIETTRLSDKCRTWMKGGSKIMFDGEHVNRVEKGKYQTLRGVTLVSNDALAP